MTTTKPIQKLEKREWGDFQTPFALALQICRLLAETGVTPGTLIEPTCGSGNFIKAALQVFPTIRQVYGVEIQPHYLPPLWADLHDVSSSLKLELTQADIFTHVFPTTVLRSQNLLIIGNPPWVTNAELGALDATNLPTKTNLKTLKGLDAKTGRSNFDLAEAIILRLLKSFAGQSGKLAMLCKNSVIKNLVEALPGLNLPLFALYAYPIDAEREFGAAVDASLLVAQLGSVESVYTCQVADFAHPQRVIKTFGWVADHFVSDTALYAQSSELEGHSPLVWRQGVKHDCAGVMELEPGERGLRNGAGEVVEIEKQWLYPLLKGSDLKDFEIKTTRKEIILTQRKIGELTSPLALDAPELWSYLLRSATFLDERKSSIYRGKPRFSIFGVGDYSFKPYKVAISGLYKRPFFSLIACIDNRPVMLDDTCYFLGFDHYQDALFTASVLNSPPVKKFLEAIVFLDAKRPYTKEVLMRIDLGKAASRLIFDDVKGFWRVVGFVPPVQLTGIDFEAFKERLNDPKTVTQPPLQLSFPV